MPRYAASTRTTGVGSTTLPFVSLYATAAVRPQLVEVGIFNTTATAFVVALARLSSIGTVGAAIAVDGANMPEQPGVSTPFQAHTGTPPTIGKEHRRATLGAAVGSGVIWTWPSEAAIEIPAATTNGICLYCPTGTGQIVDFYFVWIE